ncbi:hypothetical protein J4460_08430 [Candidatus Woesearchaeota archaeon]|nr:MAG: hypothetical protein QS99_C0012G0014 [archaeon GW2011_AR4]MBS3130664.1 hypothetical protein [Candidatus Woesearchaeota archaeon]HIH37941.1 hypothetical protein [Candidatus Woesearchaeota archaeon]HIH48633.1 hypothetical protein [Candidatus Woesearchaeota archaeon]HIJ03720.1 hypothetical protein [Candidatus Woesearchaeota archaeon]
MVEGWKKVHESKDVICFEKQTKKDNLRIEARLEEGAWHIYKTKYNGEKSNLVQQEVLSPSKDIMKKIKEMMMNQRPREQKKVQKSDRVDVKLFREYKEYDVEKWFFTVNGSPERCFIIARYGDEIKVDIVMADYLRPHEEGIIASLFEQLGLDSFFEELVLDVYYFSKESHHRRKREMLIQQVEFGFSDE